MMTTKTLRAAIYSKEGKASHGGDLPAVGRKAIVAEVHTTIKQMITKMDNDDNGCTTAILLVLQLRWYGEWIVAVWRAFNNHLN
jgi:hypothetical protein